VNSASRRHLSGFIGVISGKLELIGINGTIGRRGKVYRCYHKPPIDQVITQTERFSFMQCFLGIAFAPKRRNNIAQDNALGNGSSGKRSPERAKQHRHL
jgi:hypothetical protein